MKPREPWVPYVAPFGVYMFCLLIQGRLEPSALVWFYPIKTIITGITLLMFWRYYDELHPGMVRNGGSHSAPQSRSGTVSSVALLWGILVGAIAIVIWIGIDPLYPSVSRIFGHLSNLINRLQGQPTVEPGPPEIFNPYTIDPVGLRWTFIGFRIFGAVVVVAFMEELFWRGFLIRWLINENFKSIPLGTLTRSSFLITVLFFGLEHDQWLAGIICGTLYNVLYYRTRSLPACVIAHATSNALLAGWVLWRQDWKFW